jgi:hypothetical protein
MSKAKRRKPISVAGVGDDVELEDVSVVCYVIHYIFGFLVTYSIL